MTCLYEDEDGKCKCIDSANLGEDCPGLCFSYVVKQEEVKE